VLTDDKRQDLHRLVVARSDINEALEVARHIINHVSDERDPLWVPLQDAALVAYARPFTSNRPFGNLPSRYEKFGSPQLQDLHQQILELRHKTIAHSDAEIRSVIVVPRGVPFGPESIGTPGGVVVRTRKLPISLFKDIEAICLDLGRRLNQDADELINKVLASSEIPDHPFDLISGESVDA
jgi:hypothetical protein